MQLSVDPVPVEIELVGKTVEVLQLLLLGERSRQHTGVEQTNIGDRGQVGGHIAWILSSDPRVVVVLHPIPVKAIGMARRRDIAFDVVTLRIGSIGAHRELFHQQRPGTAHQDRRQQQQRGGHSRYPHIPEH